MKFSRFFSFGSLAVFAALSMTSARAQTQARLEADKQIVAGEKLYGAGKFDVALPYFQKAARLDRNYDNAQLWVARDYDRWGDAAIKAHSKSKARARYNAARAAYKNALRVAAPKSDLAARARRWLAELEPKINACNDSTPIRVMLNDKPLAMPLRPLIQGREVLVPLDAVMSALGAVKTEAYDPLDNTITYQLDDQSIQVQINVRVVNVESSSGGVKNRGRVILDVPLIEARSDGRDYAVIESDFFEKALGALVDWQPRAHLLKIQYPAQALADAAGVLQRVETEPTPALVVVIGKEEQHFSLAQNATFARADGEASTPIALSDLTPDSNVTLKFNARREVTAVLMQPRIAQVSPTPTPTVELPVANKIEVVKTGEVAAHAGNATALALARDGRTLATGGDDKTVRLWGLGSDAPTAGVVIKESAAVRALAFSPDGRVLASAAGRVVNLWDAATGALLHKWEGHIGAVGSLAFSPDGKLLAAGARDESTLPRGQVRLWDVEASQFRQKLDLPSACTGVAFSPSGLLATLSGTYYVDLYQPTGAGYDYDKSMSFERWQTMTSVAFAPDGAMVFTSNADGFARAWNSGGALKWKANFGSPLNAIAVSSDNRVLIGAGAGLQIWNARSGELLGAWKSDQLIIQNVAAFGQRIYGVSGDGKLRVWSWK